MSVLTPNPVYDSTALAALITTPNAATIYNSAIWMVSENMNPFKMLEGDFNSMAPIILKNELSRQGGETFSTDVMTQLVDADNGWTPNPEPNKMDQDLHTLEDEFIFRSVTVTIQAWRKTVMTSKKQMQRPAYELIPAMINGLGEYHALKKATFLLKTLINQTWTGSDSSGAFYTQQTSSYTAPGWNSNQVIAGNNANVAGLGTDDVFTHDLISIAEEVAYSGERRDGEKTFRMKAPVVNGSRHKGIWFITQFQKSDLVNNDDNFREEMIYSNTPGTDHPSWVGIDNIFRYKGHLFFVLTDELEEVLKFTTASTVVDEDGTGRTPGVKGATAMMLCARAGVRCPAKNEDYFDAEGYDNNWFKRISTGAHEGFQRVNFQEQYATAAHSTPGTAVYRDYGVVLIHTAATHHNLTGI